MSFEHISSNFKFCVKILTVYGRSHRLRTNILLKCLCWILWESFLACLDEVQEELFLCLQHWSTSESGSFVITSWYVTNLYLFHILTKTKNELQETGTTLNLTIAGKILQLAMICLPFVYIYHQKWNRICWHRSLFHWIELGWKKQKVINFDCDFGEIFHWLAFTCGQTKVYDKVHSLPCWTT